ncbi:MAG: glutathione S-transferase family protein [Deltaproteobacteria bacterium]|nr:glutathione S-transferase family protein [Deltaproteobacteria bacterium]
MLKLYDHPLSGNSYKSRLALSCLGIEYERINVDVFKGEQNSPQFAALNPNKKIPVLVDEDFIMWESNALLFYIGKKYSPNPLYPEDPKTHGAVAQWLLFGKTTIDPNLAMARYLTRFVQLQMQDQQELTKYRAHGILALKILDNHLLENEFLAGDFSIADIGCYPYVHLAPEGEIDLSAHPSVMSWCQRIESQPGYISMDE